MTAEQAVYNAIQNIAATYPDVAPMGTQAPWIVYQQVGGRSINWLENSEPGAEHARVKVSVWAETRAAAAALALQCETALRESVAAQIAPLGARIGVYEPDTGLYGTHQDFSVWVAD